MKILPCRDPELLELVDILENMNDNMMERQIDIFAKFRALVQREVSLD